MAADFLPMQNTFPKLGLYLIPSIHGLYNPKTGVNSPQKGLSNPQMGLKFHRKGLNNPQTGLDSSQERL